MDLVVAIVDAAGLLGAIIGIIMAMKHAEHLKALMADMKREAERTVKQQETLLAIEESMSTRYLSYFPIYLSEIVGLIAEAEQRVEIFCDFPAYGCFSHRRCFLDYRYQLERKLQDPKFEVEITFLDDKGRREQLSEQFSGRPKGEKFDHDLKEFISSHGRASLSFPSDDFLALVEKENVTMLEEFLCRAKQNKIHDNTPVYFWLIDRKIAIFSIASHSEKALEHGFRTIDQRLISALVEMKERYCRGFLQATPPLPPLLAAATGEVPANNGQAGS